MKRIIIDFRHIKSISLKMKAILLLQEVLQLTTEDVFIIINAVTHRGQLALLPLRINHLDFSKLDDFYKIGGEIEIRITNPK